jgi:hypothetical protein
MIKICPQLKQNLANINSLKSELDLESPKIEKLFKELKTGSRNGKEYKIERKDLINKIKSLKTEINSEIEKIEAELPTKKIEVGKEFNLKFKYRKLEEMIKAGNFGWKDDNVNSTNFPDPQEKELLGKEIKLKAKIFDFKKFIYSKDVLKELDKEGYRSATLTELLALAEIDPELQRQFKIASIGSVWRDFSGDRAEPYLDAFGLDGVLSLNLSCGGGGWNDGCRFFAIRKEAK